MRIEYLRYFNQLAKTLNFTQAARELYIAQPTLSLAVKRMEDELGFQLFDRGDGSSGVKLTPMGSAFSEYTSTILNAYDTGLRVAHEIQGEMDSTLRVGTIYAVQGRFWSQTMAAFMETRKTEPKLVIEQAYSVVLRDRLRKGELDVIFGTGGTNEEFNRVLVWSQPLVLCVRKNHPLAQRKRITLSELKGLDLITYVPKSPTTPALEEELPINEMHLHREYDDEITMCSLVSSDVNKMALLCYSFLVSAFDDVVALRIDGLPMDFQKVYLMSRHETHPKIVEDFIEFMSSYRFPNALEAGLR